MQTFHDKYGQEWRVELDLYHAKQIEEYDFGPALRKDEPYYLTLIPPQDNLFNDLIINSAVCFAFIWVLCRNQAASRTWKDYDQNKQPITSEMDFARCFDGKSLQDSRIALYKELPDFFRERKITLKDLTTRYQRAAEIMDSKSSERINRIFSDEEIERMVDAQFADSDKEVQEILDKHKQGRKVG